MALPEVLKEKYKENIKPTLDEVAEAMKVLSYHKEATKADRVALKAEKFRELSEKRLAKILKSLKTFGNLSRSQYSYTQEQNQSIFNRLTDAVVNCQKKFAKRF
jgi:DNA-binding ferritin-like protein